MSHHTDQPLPIGHPQNRTPESADPADTLKTEAELTEAAEETRRKLIEAEQEKQLGTAPAVDPDAAKKTHAYMMATSRDYASRFINRSFPKGHVFCITLEVEDDHATQELFEAVESGRALTKEETEKKVSRVPKYIAGCKVIGIYKNNIGAEYMELKRILMELGART